MRATCLCGAVSVTLSAPPEYINDCNCTLCRKAGGAWGYYSGAQVAIEGATKSYTRTDLDDPAIELHFCPHCSTVTHWTTTPAYQAAHPDMDRVGVNMRLFDPDTLGGVELRFPDGKNWTEERPLPRRDPVTIGPGFRW